MRDVMDSRYPSHAHTPSMSSLASTIVPMFFESPSWDSPTSLAVAEPAISDLPDALTIPLPPSLAGSVYGDDSELSVAAETLGKPEIPSAPANAEKVFVEDKETNPSTKESEDRRPRTLPSAGRVTPIEQTAGPADTGVTSLDRLVHMLRDDAYQTRRFEALQAHVQDLMLYCHTAGNLIPRQSHLFRSMVNCLKTDNSTAFALLYTQAVQLRESNTFPDKLMRNYSSINSPLTPFPGTHLSWLHTLSPDIQQGIMNMLCMIRSSPEYLARRLANLSTSQLSNLAQPHRQSAVLESVLRNPGAGSPFPGKLRINLAKAGEDSKLPTDLDVQNGPLFVLLHYVFQDKSPSDVLERSRRCDVWSTTCAHLIEEGKADPDDFCMAILDVFATLSPWSTGPQLETFLKGLVQSGAFILEPPGDQQVDFTKSEETLELSKKTTITEYFDNALKSLTQLLTSGPSQEIMPESSLHLIHAILRKVVNLEKRKKAQNFFVRWYCTSFVSNALICPESIGIMLDCHINVAVRQKLFHELAVRFRNAVFDALSPWKSSLPSIGEIQNNATKLIKCFEPSRSATGFVKSPSTETSTTTYLMLSPNDVLSIAKIVHPDNISHMSTHGSFANSIFSKASSVAGSSTLTSGTDEPRTGTASSTATSEAGTSMTSDVSSTHMYVGDRYDTRKDTQPSGRYLPVHSSTVNVPDLDNEHFMDRVMLELSRLVSDGSISTTTPGNSENKHAVIYIKNSGGLISLNSEPFEKELTEVNLFMELLKKQTLASHLPSENNLLHLVEGLVRLSQFEGTAHYVRDDIARAFSNALEARFQDQIVLSDTRYDYQSSHFWWRCLHILKDLDPGPRELLLTAIGTVCEIRSRFIQKAIKQYEAHRAILQWERMSHDNEIDNLASQCGRLRDKMWFSSRVKYSSTYQEALNVTRVLRSMSKSSQSKATGMAAWTRQRLRSSIGPDRARQQTLEVLAAPKDHGGPSKMSDDQVELTSRWLTGQSIENFCKGEERLHRFCLEIQKSVNKLVGETVLDSPFLWSSSLYQHEKQYYGVGHGQPTIQTGSKYQPWKRTTTSSSLPSSDQNLASMFDPSHDISTNFHTTGRANIPDAKYRRLDVYLDGVPRQESLRIIGTSYRDEQPSTTFQSSPLPLSPVSPTSHVTSLMRPSDPPAIALKQEFLTQLRETVTSLMLSELGSNLWNDGSETDRWINDASVNAPPNPPIIASPSLSLARENGMALNLVDSGSSMVDKHSLSSIVKGEPSTGHSSGPPTLADLQSQSSALKTEFPFREAYRRILTKFGLSSNPYDKLRLLYELTALLTTSENSKNDRTSPLSSVFSRSSSHNLLSPNLKPLGAPRTRLTRLEEVSANCEDRWMHSIKSHSDIGNTQNSPTFRWAVNRTDPNILPLLQSMLRDPHLRPSTLFRDLQYIAAFVPSSILDETPLGTAFWTVGLAAITVKSELSLQTTLRANLIVAYHYNHQPKRENPTSAEPRRVSLGASDEPIVVALNDPSLKETTLADAANLYTISALEGDPTAARELALFHLTHPELVRRVTLPFSRPGEVFRSANNSAGNAKEGQARGGLDPMSFAVAFHWMEVAANAGDKDARAFLKENGDLGRGW